MPRSLQLFVPLALAFALVPRAVDACDPAPCYYSDKWQDFQFTSELVATDGVLVLRTERGGDSDLSDADALPALSATVTQDGQPITGAFEAAEGWRGVIWRPDAPLVPGAALAMTLTVDNDSLGDDDCFPEGLDLGPFDATVAPGAIPDLLDVGPVGEGELVISETPELESMVCCDGAYPIFESSCGVGVSWNQGHCEPTRGIGRVRTNWAIEIEMVSAELRDNIAWRVHTDAGVLAAHPGQSSIAFGREEPACSQVELLNRATGETMLYDEECFGDEFADTLGPLDLDPSEGLLGECSGDGYICEVVDDAWDPDACMPYETEGGDGDGDGDGDTGDTGDGDGDTGDGDGDTGDGDGDSGGGETGDGDNDTGNDSGATEGDGGCSCSADTRPTAPIALGFIALLGLLRPRRRQR